MSWSKPGMIECSSFKVRSEFFFWKNLHFKNFSCLYSRKQTLAISRILASMSKMHLGIQRTFRIPFPGLTKLEWTASIRLRESQETVLASCPKLYALCSLHPPKSFKCAIQVATQGMKRTKFYSDSWFFLLLWFFIADSSIAKPGFGKTFISTSVIDDLRAEAEDLNISDDPPSTAYFHFNAAHIYCTHSNDAFRALAYQLVHAHRHDRPTLDALSLLIRKASNKEKASSDDVVAVLSLLLRQHSTFLVIDGVDECSDVETFLTLLPEVCRKSDTRAILFSRPSIEIPLEYQKWASDSPHIVSLSEEDNVADIEACVTESLNRMADQGFFGISMDRTLIQNVARKSDGTFLWASLLLKLLQSPVLSPNERRVALEQAQYLEGVEALYHNIFSILDQQPQNEKQTSADAFCWLSSSINRLCIPAFQTALATGPGKFIKESQDICEFTDSITRLTCGLIEVTDCSIIFSHSSVKEFLQSPKFADSDFGLYDSSKVHARLATRCLTFLAHDIPKRPLQRLQPYIRPATTSPNAQSSGLSMRTSRSGDSGYKSMSSSSDTETPHMHPHAPPNAAAAATAPPFDAQLPLLRYAALCWPIHLSKALACTSASVSIPHTPWLAPLSHFLTDRPALTAWVEASWR